ncbi:MAG: DNA repair protein RadA [Dictyoglomus sp. NZ13-RE01]|nr:MAG: DNA repair protein RadA [Dictyoglomus sp. NZ13-RE01]
MTKLKVKYVCQVCGYESIGWFGKCPNCGTFGSLVEVKEEPSQRKETRLEAKTYYLKDVDLAETKRIISNFKEFDDLLGGGIVPGSLLLLAGEPGIGKSTLLLQLAFSLQENGYNVLYVSGEESLSQIKYRAERISSKIPPVKFLAENNLELILDILNRENFSLVIIDSIQTIYSDEFPTSPGSVVQIRECTSRLMRVAKKKNTALFLIGHITKEGDIAGPKLLEHLVDVVLYLEGERYQELRILRAIKNRFGPTNDLALYEMRNDGLVEVSNVSKKLLEGRNKNISGSLVVPVIEGTKSILVEIQSLISRSNTTFPRRLSIGVDINKLAMIIAILEKKLNLKLFDKDVFFNVIGGIKINEPAIDLGIAFSLISSYYDNVFPEDTVVFGEVGLGGEVRSVSNIEKRIKEAHKLGFKKVILPRTESISKFKDIMLFPISSIEEGAKIVWGRE